MKFSLRSNQILIIMIFMLSIVTLLFGSSYALVQKIVAGTNNYNITVGNFWLEFNDNNTISLQNSYPVLDSEGLNQENEFAFSITNNGDYTASYTLIIEETSENKISEAIRYSYNQNNNGYTNVTSLGVNKCVVQNMILKINETDNYRMKFWMDINADASYMNKTFSAKIVVDATQSEYKYASTVIENLANYNSDNIYGFNKNGEYATVDVLEYRYVGKDANNYVWFNCQEGYTKGEDKCEKWRIIGSFKNTWENGVREYSSLKIVRDEITDKILNDYYSNLSLNAQSMVLRGKWSNKILDLEDIPSISYFKEKEQYSFDNVGLVSINDYIYASGTNNYFNKISAIDNSNNWLNKDKLWLTSSVTNEDTTIKNIGITSDHKITLLDNTNSSGFRPVVNLKPDVSIISGFGTKENPYEIKIDFPMNYGTVTKNNYIFYHTNGGIINKDYQIINTSGTTTIINNIPTRDNSTFLGWSDTSDGDVKYYPNDVIYIENDLNLYAIWK